MNRIVLLATALLLPLAGCLGFPEGTVSPGDTVAADVTITDAETGEDLIVNERKQFAVGTGTSNLGFGFERSTIGMEEGDSKRFTLGADSSMGWTETVSVQGLFEDALEGTIDQAQFEQFFGELGVGETFTPEFSFYDFRVEDITDGIVTYRAMPVDGQQNELENLGAILETTVDAERDVMVQRLLADVGKTFNIDPPSPFNPNTPLGLEPGAYRAFGNEGDEIVYEYSPAGDHRLIGRDLAVQVIIVSITEGAATDAEPVDGNYGVRASPVLNGSPSKQFSYGPYSDAEHHSSEPADGHAH